jgi:hypothetical protein
MLMQVLKCPDGIQMYNALDFAIRAASVVGNMRIPQAILPHMGHYEQHKRARDSAAALVLALNWPS